METAQALECVGLLEAGFARELSDASKMVFVHELLPYDQDVVRRAVTNLIRTEKWLPSIAELLEEIRDVERDKRHAEGLNRPALKAETWTDEDERRAKDAMRELIAAWREQHPRTDPLPQVTGGKTTAHEPVPFDDPTRYDPEIIEANRRKADSLLENAEAEGHA